MLIEQVDAIGAHARQRFIGNRADALRAAVEALRGNPVHEPDLAAITTWSRTGSSASPRTSSLRPGP
jgi:hypothetical protein